ncbi:MAG: sigma-70 family RNA polymerase sigma factor [Muribaculaceae bacterium]|nr:sigma-70 family RNA polymerase sigma factor [Muribaculaceae bacterium]
MTRKTEKEKNFLAITSQYKEMIAKVCYLYSGPEGTFDDLYQEILINLWQGMDSFRGDAKVSTWIYRMAINTCISWHRRNSRHSSNYRLDDVIYDKADTSDNATAFEEYRELYRLISLLGPIDKALITLWLDEKSYEEIGSITGISTSNVAVRIHRIKEKLSKMAAQSGFTKG